MTMSPDVWLHLALCVGALVIGGVLKGATGAGAPIVAVPMISLFYGVQTAIVAMMVSNLLSNVVQGWRYRADVPTGPFAWVFAGGGLVGAALGTVMLARVSPQILLNTMAVMIVAYILFRLLRPDWALSRRAAGRLALPVGAIGGLLQGATGISAPVSISFVNALRMSRAAFIATISLFFSAMTLAQIPFLVGYGILTWHGMIISTGAFLVILAAMPLGEALALRLSAAVFDRLILVLLAVIALNIFL